MWAPGIPIEFFKGMSGSKLWYLEENVGPWDPDGILKMKSGSTLWYLEEMWDPGTPIDFFK